MGRAYSREPTARSSAASSESPRSRSTAISASSSAYLSRTAISSARVPEHVIRRTRPRSSSKSASQIQDTSRPSAIRSLRASQRSSESSSSVSVRSTSLAPAGFLIRRIDSSRPPTAIVSTRPNAPLKDSSASPAVASGTPSSSAVATAATAL